MVRRVPGAAHQTAPCSLPAYPAPTAPPPEGRVAGRKNCRRTDGHRVTGARRPDVSFTGRTCQLWDWGGESKQRDCYQLSRIAVEEVNNKGRCSCPTATVMWALVGCSCGRIHHISPPPSPVKSGKNQVWTVTHALWRRPARFMEH